MKASQPAAKQVKRIKNNLAHSLGVAKVCARHEHGLPEVCRFHRASAKWQKRSLRKARKVLKAVKARKRAAKARARARARARAAAPPRGSIVALGRWLQQRGYRVSEHPAFGGVNGRHAPGGCHYRACAIDVNADHFARGEYAALDAIAHRLRSAGYYVLWRTANHYDHLHAQT